MSRDPVAWLKFQLLQETPALVDDLFHEFYDRNGIDDVLDEAGEEVCLDIKHRMRFKIERFVSKWRETDVTPSE